MKFLEAYNEKSSKPQDYFPIYDEIFRHVDRLQQLNILEIGVDKAAGLRALKNYFPNSNIYGLDINPVCKSYENEGIQITIGSQTDKNVLEKFSDKNLDIIIDDGSHNNFHVFETFSFLFKNLNPNNAGLYIIEDTHTSYWPFFNGGYGNKNSTIEKFKNIIDQIHAWCIRDRASSYHYEGCPIEQTYFEKWVSFIQFYENICVIKKRKTEARCSHCK